jgi:hypothetical protein
MAFEGSFYGDWTTISIAAAAISVIGASILIMLSRLFGLRNLEQIAKTEFIYAASTVLIVMMVAGFITYGEPILAGGGSSVARSLYLSSLQCPPDATVAFPQQTTLIDWMKLYLQTPTECVQQFMNVLYAIAIPVDALATFYMEIFMSEQASGYGVKWLSERIANTTKSLAFYMYIYYLLMHILNFVKYYAGFFFSIGVALRAFPPTRGVGAYLMAVSFGLYFVFPLAYILLATMALPHAASEIVVPEGGGSSCVPNPDGSFEYTCSLPAVTDPQTYQCGGANSGRVAEYTDVLRENAASLEEMMTVHVTDFSKHLVSAICIFPLVALVVLITFVLNTTNLFGGNIPEIGRGLVKLI